MKRREWKSSWKGTWLVLTSQRWRVGCVPEDTPSVGHHDRAKTLVCLPDPCCLPPYYLEHWAFAVVCDWMLELKSDFVNVLVFALWRNMLYLKISGVWQADHLDNLIFMCLSSACLLCFLFTVSLNPTIFCFYCSWCSKYLMGKKH